MDGVIPGIIIGIALMIVSYFSAKKHGYPRSDKTLGLKYFMKNFVDSFWALLVPVIIMGGIYGGIFTPTEAAVVVVVYALFIGKFIYKELDYETTKAAFRDAVMVNGATSFMLGLSMSFATYLTMEQIPMRVGAWIITVSSEPWIILFLINLMLLVVGCFVDNISSMIILTPIFLPVIKQIGIDPVHFGVVMTLALAIGFITPPYGANLFVASAVSGEKLDSISKKIFPFVGAMVVCLALFTYFPGISMGLVNLLMR